MEKLTKENFWNELYEQYPSEVDQFCRWIDEYKVRVDWKNLFYSPHSPQQRDIKYHDIPIAMQVGIFAQFAFEHGCGDSHTFINDDVIVSMDDFIQAIRNYFLELKAFKDRETNASENFDEEE